MNLKLIGFKMVALVLLAAAQAIISGASAYYTLALFGQKPNYELIAWASGVTFGGIIMFIALSKRN